MYRNSARMDAFEKAQMRRQPPDHLRNLRLFESLFQEARALGVMPLSDPLEGIEVDVRLARAVNVRTTPGADRSPSG